MDSPQLSTLLLVDDNPALLHTTQALLASSHWHCVARNDTVSALCAIVELNPTAVLVDCDAGPLDAWKFCLLVKEHPDFSHTRLILVSRQDDAYARAKASAAGADAMLVKPFSAEELAELLSAQCGMAA